MAGFTKIFSSMLDSTIWDEPWDVKGVWITMLAMANRNGNVMASVPGLARRATVSLEACENALSKFLAPDKYSRTPDQEGRRIEVIEGGWHLLNYVKYREMRDEDARKEYQKDWVKDKRCRQNVSTVDQEKPQSTQAEAEAYTDTKETTTTTPTSVGSVAEVAPPKEKKKSKPRGRDFSIQALAMSSDQQAEFDRLWNCYPKLGWDFRSRKEQPRRINYAEAAKRYKEILDYTDVRRADGSRITPADLSDAMVAWVASRWAEAKRQGLPAPCIPCIGNLLSSVEGEKNHWKEALLTHFDAIPEAS